MACIKIAVLAVYVCVPPYFVTQVLVCRMLLYVAENETNTD